jgi:hypothetical protein
MELYMCRIQIKVAIVLLAFALAIVGCGGGGGGANLPAPNPNPGTQQPGPQQPQASPPDTSNVVAIFDSQKMEFSMGSGVNAVLPGATVIIEDPQNFVATTTASQDGSFEFLQQDVPPNFMTAPGTQIGIMQFDATTARSEPAFVTIQLLPMGP